MKYPSFYDIVDPFKVVLLDSYGVLKNHTGIINGVENTVTKLREKRKIIRVLTNDASRSQEQQVTRFENIGLSGLSTHEVITSAMLARQFLSQKITEGKVAYLGTDNSADYIIQTGLEHIPVRDVDMNRLDELSAFVFLDDEGFDWNTDINKTVNILRKRTMPIIIANTDKLYPVADNDVAVATGGIAKLVQNMMGKKFIKFGKPDSQMFMYAYEQINGRHDYPIEKSDIIMVGDTLHTDILGGNKFGVKTMLVLSGNTRPESVDLQIKSTGIIPDYICESIIE